MTKKAGRPHVAGSIINKFRQFFETNPDEELTYSDAATKFDCTIRQAQCAAQYLARQGNLESVHVVRTPQAGRAS